MAISGIDPSQNEVLAGLEARAKKPNRFYRVMAHRPEVLKNFTPFYGAIMGPGAVERRAKEIAYLAAAMANRCDFCTHAHIAAARRAGVTDEEIEAIRGERNDSFPAVEQLVLTFSRELTRTARVEDSTRESLAAHFTDEQIVELTLVVAAANFTNRFNNGLGILPEE